MKYKVISYSEHNNCHECIDDRGEKRYIDLMVNGDFPEETLPEFLIGNTYEADYDYPYISIAMSVNPTPIQ